MTLTIATDILFHDDIEPDRLRRVSARAFHVAPEMVAVAEAAGHFPIPDDAKVILLHRSWNMPGDFPIWYGLTVDDDLVEHVDRALNTVAHGLGTVALSDADDDRDMTIHLPDGSGHVVRLTQDDDDAFRITPEMRQLIDGAMRRSRETEDTSNAPMTTTRAQKVIAS